MNIKYITLLDTEPGGEAITHAAFGVTNYATPCGVSSDDDQFVEVPTPRGQRINCTSCRAMFYEFRNYRATDFVA